MTCEAQTKLYGGGGCTEATYKTAGCFTTYLARAKCRGESQVWQAEKKINNICQALLIYANFSFYPKIHSFIPKTR